MIIKSLKLNDKGANVLKAQKLLQKTGSTVKATGIYNIGMLSAVRAFQKKNGLKATGILDAKTFAKLESVSAKKNVKMVPKKK